MTIKNRQGKTVKVTDLAAGIEQATAYVQMHEKCKEQAETDPEIIYFEDAHKDWAHDLEQLQILNTEVK